MTNILVAFSNLVKNKDFNLKTRYRSKNRANSMGDALEFFVKDLFCGSLDVGGVVSKNKEN